MVHLFKFDSISFVCIGVINCIYFVPTPPKNSTIKTISAGDESGRDVDNDDDGGGGEDE